MAYTIPTGEPLEVFAGDLIKWKIPEDDDFLLASSWVLSYAIIMAGNQFEITCTDDGDNHHLATVTAADSTKWKPGTYKWQSYITNGTERYSVSTGEIIIQPNFATLGGGYDSRTHAEKVLASIEATIEGTATQDQSSVSINGQQLSRTPKGDLIMFRNKYRIEVASEKRAERVAKGLGHHGTIKVRM